MFSGEIKEIEEKLRACFRKQIGADTEQADKSKGVNIQYNEHKGVFQASVQVGDQMIVKEFKLKADAEHWADLVHSLETAGKLKGHISIIQKAAAHRKATQEAYDQILAGKGVFTPEEDPHYQYQSKDGQDVWASMFSRYQEPKKTKPEAGIRVHKGSLEELLVLGSKKHILGELLGWCHKLLGWRVTLILTHAGEDGALEAVQQKASDLDLQHIGFIRCTADAATPELSDADKSKLQKLREEVPKSVAAVVGYSTVTGELRAWTGKSSSSSSSSIFEEVELGTIVRRVDGETFHVESAISKPSLMETMQSKVQEHFHKNVRERTATAQPDPECEAMGMFKKVSILGDGRCFWHCFLFYSLHADYINVPRNPGGGPKDPQRLLEEVRRAKRLWEEVEKEVKNAGMPVDLTKSMVDVKDVELVATAMKAHFRITVDPKARAFHVQHSRDHGGYSILRRTLSKEQHENKQAKPDHEPLHDDQQGKHESKPEDQQEQQHQEPGHEVMQDKQPQQEQREQEQGKPDHAQSTASFEPTLEDLKGVSKIIAINSHWHDLILNGSKTWELRNSPWRFRGEVGIWSNSKVHGLVSVVGCFLVALKGDDGRWEPFDDSQAAADVFVMADKSIEKHQVPMENLLLLARKWERIYAYVLENPRSFTRPLPIKIKQGAQFVQNMDAEQWSAALETKGTENPAETEEQQPDLRVLGVCRREAFRILDDDVGLLVKTYKIQTGSLHVAIFEHGAAIIVGQLQICEVQELKTLKALRKLEADGYKHLLDENSRTFQPLRNKEKALYGWMIQSKEAVNPPLVWKADLCQHPVGCQKPKIECKSWGTSKIQRRQN
ncbi:unnamed protein product [Durusdinium trenchii]|uniref:OTU domain-containing protein n=1 Tax=Durusdinium trenchii TaxID=1381693 RepID=A0ABP0HKW1_9DINO